MEWILCEDRLPKNDDWKIITILDEHGDTPYRYSDFGWYFDTAKCWIVDAEPRTDVLAWMSLPLPYNADRKTEPTISKMEQVDEDINVRSKWETPPKFEHKGIITTCVGVPMALVEDEPQTEREGE